MSLHTFETTARPSLGAGPTALWEEWHLVLRKFTGSATVSRETSAATRMPRFRVENTPLLISRSRDATVVSSLTKVEVEGGGETESRGTLLS